MKVSNPLADLLYSDDLIAPNPYQHTYERGMSITINNHKQDTASILQKIRKQYQSIWYCLTDNNISMENIKLWNYRTSPPRGKIMDIVASKSILMVAAIHSYNYIDKYSSRGSKCNIDTEHLHMYIYGAHHYLPNSELELNNKINRLIRLLGRHNIRKNNYVKRFIDVKPVGTGKHKFNDIITPTDLYDYINLPRTNPTKDCWINYIANSKNLDQPTYPLFFLYKEDK